MGVYQGAMLGNATCKRIDLLIHHYLQKVSVTDGGWTINYIDPEDGRYWLLTYPSGEMQGGGPTLLSVIPKSVAKELLNK